MKIIPIWRSWICLKAFSALWQVILRTVAIVTLPPWLLGLPRASRFPSDPSPLRLWLWWTSMLLSVVWMSVILWAAPCWAADFVSSIEKYSFFLSIVFPALSHYPGTCLFKLESLQSLFTLIKLQAGYLGLVFSSANLPHSGISCLLRQVLSVISQTLIFMFSNLPTCYSFYSSTGGVNHTNISLWHLTYLSLWTKPFPHFWISDVWEI